MRALLRVFAIPVGALILLAALVPCVCPAPPGSGAGEHDCCLPEAGIRAANGADCCSSMPVASPGLIAPATAQCGTPALVAGPMPELRQAFARLASPGVASAASPPSVLRI